MAHSLTTIGLHLDCDIQAEMVVELELALIERKQSLHHIQESYERVRKGAKVKGRVELKIDKPRGKIVSYDFPKLHHSNPNSFRANVHLRQFKKGVRS